MDQSKIKFPIEIFPSVIQDSILHNKEILNFDINLQGGSYLSAMASSLGTNVKLFNGKYSSFPALWISLVASPGSRKSHIMGWPFQAIKEEDTNSYNTFRKALQDWEKENRNERGSRPEFKSTILKDFTPEVLIKSHMSNTKGLVLFQDELAGWLQNFNKYNKGSGERDQYLTLWNCDALKVDRSGADPLYIPQSCVNILGGIQPKRVGQIFDKGSDDGFAYRWLFCSPQSNIEPPTWDSKERDSRLVKREMDFMSELNETFPLMLSISAEANDHYKHWFNVRNIENCYNDSEMGWQTKMETYIWRFCIVLEMMDQVSTGKSRKVVPGYIMERALSLEEYFKQERIKLSSTQNYDLLEKESDEFQKAYKELGNKPYKRKELNDHFSRYLKKEKLSERTMDNKYNSDLFTKNGTGVYIKSIQND